MLWHDFATTATRSRMTRGKSWKEPSVDASTPGTKGRLCADQWSARPFDQPLARIQRHARTSRLLAFCALTFVLTFVLEFLS